MEVKFARSESVAGAVIHLLDSATGSIDAAIYRVNHPGLARALAEAAKRGVSVRLLVDGNKFRESSATQELLRSAQVPFRLGFGRKGRGSKMHHKFVILDRRTILTGSYNWTLESENENYENILISDKEKLVEAYALEFEALWAGAIRNEGVLSNSISGS